MRYTLEMREECGGSETTTIEAADDQEARSLAEDELRSWVRDGEYGDAGASVSAHYTLTDEDDEVIADDEGITVEIDPKHDALIRAAGGDPDCDHDWTGEGEGGCDENPGVWSTGGTALSIRDHCRKCGLRRHQSITGVQCNPGEHNTVEYEQPESWCAECERVECECEPATTYYVETYGGDGSWADPRLAEHNTLEAAIADVAGRLGRFPSDINVMGDWLPDTDMHGDGVPDGARPVGAWHESEADGCGGVAMWSLTASTATA